MRGRVEVFRTRARDEFSGKCPAGCGIINLDSSKGPGTHFTLWFNYPTADRVYYFDSFGVVPPTEISTWLKTSGKPTYYSSDHLQPIASKMCGKYCVFVAEKLAENIGKSADPLYLALENFSRDPAANDELIASHFGRQNL